MSTNIDKFKKGAVDWTGAVGAGGVSDASVTTVPLVSSTGLPTDTGLQITIDRVDANGTATPAKKEVISGVVSSDNLISCVRGVEGTAQAHSAGAVVEVMLTAGMWDDMVDGILVEHGQDGKHGPAFHALTEKTTPVDADEIGLIDSAASFVLKKLSFLNLKIAIGSYLQPVGTVYTNYSDATNPATIFGFGTWVAIEGEVVVGFKSGDASFGTAGGAVGTKTHTLTTAELAVHTHTQNAHAHSASISPNSVVTERDANWGMRYGAPEVGVNYQHSISVTVDAATATNQNTGSGTAHNNIQPSRICYVWRRSA